VDLRWCCRCRIARSQVQGSVTLAGNDVQITPGQPQLAGRAAR
jgi:hypothetical protein